MLTAIAIMALGAIVLGAALGFASIKFKVGATRWSRRSRRSCRRRSAASAGTPAAAPTPKPSSKGRGRHQPLPARRHGRRGQARRPAQARDQAARSRRKPKSVAFIGEQTCIGCTLCIQACPVDAIVGAAKQMHTIVAELLPAANCACRRAGRVHHDGTDHREPRQLEMEVSGHRTEEGRMSQQRKNPR